uniref:Rab-GAP TBC domain-containing protein n=2 Tax=Spongospora subterranea TaxID=70186 RepID=A0A0H5QG17_9EUKA|eukprot:CRZ00890.1 hypothetical protein [Spongospora subterranea]
MQFAFRWMNCFLIRELPLEVVVRFWDSYIGDESNSGFTSFHVYISAALLTFYAPHLKTLEFPDLLLFLQGLPTKELSFRDVESILSQGFVYQSIFNNTKF